MGTHAVAPALPGLLFVAGTIMSKVTIEDISRQTQLSRGTVSRALNDRPDISAHTKQRVLEACRELNYVPSQAARSLATGRSYAVAVVVDDLLDVSATSFLRGVIARAEDARYAVYVVELGADADKRLARANRITRERVDGILIAARLEPPLTTPVREALASQTIVLCQPAGGINADVLVSDEAESGRLVARHLLDRAGQDVLYVQQGPRRERLDGFQQVLAERGIAGATATIELGSNADAAELRMALEPHIGRVRGIAACDDAVALCVMLALQHAGRVVGEDVAVAGQGNSRAGAQIRPALTTTDLSGEEIGRRAMDLALQRLSKTRLDAPGQTAVAPTLIERKSSRLA